MSTTQQPKFIRRFDAIWARKRLSHLGQALFWTLAVLLAGFTLLCALDYYFEIQWNARAWSLSTLCSGCVIFGGYQAVRTLRYWNRGSTAAQIEQSFPQLGQSVRTAVQFGTATEASPSGVAETLVEQLEEQADEQTRPLQLDSILPKLQLCITGIGIAGAVILLMIAAGSDWEWRRATTRALLGDQPYTTLEVTPGNCAVLEGEDQEIAFRISGRQREQVAVYTRDSVDGPWTPLEITEDDLRSQQPLLHEYAVLVSSIDEPFAYKVNVGDLESEIYQVDVHYPLEIQKITANISAPEYTGLADKEVEGGNLNAISGSEIQLRVELDRPAASASIALRPVGQSSGDSASAEEIQMSIDGNALVAHLSITDHRVYQIEAIAPDGMKLPENNFRIRVRHDQPPKVWFESPEEALEVHTLAEVLMRIRTTDDFGLSKAGIAFEINNEESFELINEDFQTLADALESEEQISLKTRAMLQEILPLEAITLTQKDSVTYYAFAEDNYPDGVHRTESDLRFIDIRPFRRLYREIDPMSGMPGQNRDLATLDELIARQRFSLNRTVRIRRRDESGATIDLNTIDRLIDFQTEVADYTQRLAKFLEGIGLDGSDLLYQAQESMLATVDSLSVGKYETAELQEKDALRFLIEGRDKINIALAKNRNSQLAQRLRRFDRTQTQKLRRPRSEQEEAEELANRIEQLASRQEFVYETLSGLKMDNPNQTNSQSQSNNGSSGRNQRPNPMPRPNTSNNQGSSGQGQSGNNNSQGQNGSSGQNNNNNNNTEGERPEGSQGNMPNDPQGDRESEDGNAGENQTSNAAGGQQTESEGDNTEGTQGDGETEDGQGSTEGEPGDSPETGEGETSEGEGETGGEQGEMPAGTESQDSDGEGSGSGPTQEELEEQQRQIAMDAEQIASELQDINDATELLRQRMQEIAEAAADLESALAGRDEQSVAMAEAAAAQLREAARNVRGVMAPEATDRVAMARDMASRIARGERELSDRLGESEGSAGGNQAAGGQGGSSDGSEQLQKAAAALAESGKTLQDILESIEKGFNPAGQASVSQIEQMLNEGKVQDSVGQMENLSQMIGSDRPDDAALNANDIADQMDVTSTRLDTIHRNVVAPKVEQIRRLQQRALTLAAQLEDRETMRQVGSWHRLAEELLEALQQQGVAAGSSDQLREAMQQSGAGNGGLTQRYNWSVGGNGYYNAPSGYASAAERIIEDLERHIGELVLGDLMSSDEGAVPPEYESLVDRYLEVLSNESQ